MNMNAKILIPSLMTLALTACGGGDSSSGGGSGTGGGSGGGEGSEPDVSYTVSTSYNSMHGEISPTSAVVDENTKTSFEVTPADGFEIQNVSGCSGSLAGSTYTTGNITDDCTVSATFSELNVVSGAFCFEGYCDGEDPKEVKHNLFEDRKYTAHYIAIAPAETNLKYNVSPDFGKIEKIEVTEDASGDAFSYDYKINENEIVIHNPYSYNSEPLVNYTVRMTSETGELAKETVSIMYFNPYESGRFTNFNDTPVALPMSGSKTFKVELQNYGAADSKEILIRDFNMLIPSIVGSVDENDTCDVVEGSVTLESCDLISMSVDNENNEVTITTNLSSLINNNRESFNSGLNLYPYIAVCVSTLKDKLNPEDCEDMYMAGMNGFISEYNNQEQAKIDELQTLMPEVRAFFEYDVAIKELANLLNAQGYISNEVREEYISAIRFWSAPLVQEYNIAMQEIFNINSTYVSGLQDQENLVQTRIEYIQYYLQYDLREKEKSSLYNSLINEAGVSDTYGYLDTSSPVTTGDDNQPTRFAYNESYGQIIDGKFVFDNKYRILNLAVKKSKK